MNEVVSDTKISSYDRSIVWNYIAYVYGEGEDYTGALGAYESLLKEPGATPVQRRGALYTVAQVSLLNEDYNRAVEALTEWFEISRSLGESFKPNNYFLLAQTSYQKGDFSAALENATQTLRLARCLEKEPREDWLRMSAGLNLQQDLVETALLPTQLLVMLYPKRTYWIQLQHIYASLDREIDQTTALKLAWRLGLMERENEYLALAQSIGGRGVPSVAVQVLEEGFANGIVTDKASNIRLLANMYHRAQELQKAIDTYGKAGVAHEREREASKARSAHYLSGLLNLETAQYSAAEESFQKVIDLNPGDDQRLEAVVNLARVIDEQGRTQEALDLLLAQPEAEQEDTPVSLKNWTKHLRTDIEVRKAHEEFMNLRREQIEDIRQAMARTRN